MIKMMLFCLARACSGPQSRDRVIDAAIAGCCSGALSRLTLFELEDSQDRNLSYCLRSDANDSVPPTHYPH